MLSQADRVLETSTSTGNGPLTLAGAVPGLRLLPNTPSSVAELASKYEC